MGKSTEVLGMINTVVNHQIVSAGEEDPGGGRQSHFPSPIWGQS